MQHDDVWEYSFQTMPETYQAKNMLEWLNNALKTFTAKWKIVVGHHPLWSTGGNKFEENHVLRPLLLPILCPYADAYFAGHEHILEIHTDSCESVFGEKRGQPLVQVLFGAGSKQRSIHTTFKAYQDKNYPQNEAIWVKGLAWGFSHVEIEDDMATVCMITTPDSSKGTPIVEYTYTFLRRSAAAIQ